jgi:hypothetical protein
MKKWRGEIHPETLREMLPDLALKMETAFLVHELRALGMRVTRRPREKGKSFLIEIALDPHHVMRIAPVERGPRGYAEWGRYVKPNTLGKSLFEAAGGSTEEPHKHMHFIRAHIQVLDISGEKPEILSGTFGDTSLLSLIKNVLTVIQRTQKLSLLPSERGPQPNE